MKKIILFFLFISGGFAAIAQQTKIKEKKTGVVKKKEVYVIPNKLPGKRVMITTDSGIIVVRLYDQTPLHRDNFIKLVKEHYYDSLLFHRVIWHFMIQGGDPDSKNAQPGQMLGNGGPGYTIPAEFDSTLFHKRGALAAARQPDQVNPKKESNGSQFYIVQGKTFTNDELDMLEKQRNIVIPASRRPTYNTIGGTPHLDMNYTVFGEVEKGMEVVDKISLAAKDGNNRPLTDIRMKMEMVPDVPPAKTKIKTPTVKTKIKTK